MVKVKKKTTNKSLSLIIRSKNINKQLFNILSIFDIKNIFLQIFSNNLKFDVFQDFLKNNNINYILDKNCLTLDINKIFLKEIFSLIELIDYDEINIFNKYISWQQFNINNKKTSFKDIDILPDFYLNFNVYENNYLEIICDLSYNKDEILEKLNKL